MKFPYQNKILGTSLIIVALVSLYFSVIPGLVLTCNKELIRSINLYDYGNLTQTVKFEMSDVVLFNATIRWANTYTLTISDETGDIYSLSGRIDDSVTKIKVPLYPPAFHPSRAYIYCLNVHALNFPILGAILSDSHMGLLSVEDTDTTLNLNASINQNSHQLTMTTTLANRDFEPIANQTVSFHLQPNIDSPLPNKGWITLGSTTTDNQGQAILNIVCNIGGGQHRIQARFNSEDFKDTTADSYILIDPITSTIEFSVERSSKEAKITAKLTDPNGLPLSQRLVYFQPNIGNSQYAITDVNGLANLFLRNIADDTKQVILNFTVFKDRFTSETKQIISIDLKPNTLMQSNLSKLKTEPSEERPGLSRVDDPEPDDLEITCSTTNWISLVKNSLCTLYTTTEDLDKLTFDFYFNHTELLGNATIKPMHLGELYIYIAYFYWTPRELRYLGDSEFHINLTDASQTLIAEGSLQINITKCPNQLRLLFPDTFVGENLNLMIVVSFPRVYQAPTPLDYVHTYRLAQEFNHDNTTYMVDDLELSAPVFVGVYENFVLKENVSLSESGLETVSLGVDFSNITWMDVLANITSGLTTQGYAREFITLTNSSVVCANVTSENFSFSSGVLGLDTYNRSRVGADTNVETYVDAFGNPLSNLSVTNLAGRLWMKGDSKLNFTSDERHFLRLSLFYYENSTAPSYVDLDKDGEITIFDVVLVTTRYGIDIEESLDWVTDHQYDVDGSGMIDIFDIIAISSNFNKKVYYVAEDDPSEILAKFYYENGTLCSESALDIEGCVIFPEDAHNLTLEWESDVVYAKYENFSIISEVIGSTDFNGYFNSSFNPASKGVYLVQSKAPSNFEVTQVRFGIYFDNGTVLQDPLNMLQDLNVIRSPTGIVLDYAPDNGTGAESVTVAAALMDEFRGEPVSSASLSFKLYNVTGDVENLIDTDSDTTNSSGIALYSFSPNSSIYKVSATFATNGTLFGSTGDIFIEARDFTQMNITVDDAMVGNSTFIDLSAGENHEFDVDVTPVESSMGRVLVYVNEGFYANISHSDQFDWNTTDSGVYYFNVSYEGEDETRPCKWYFGVNVSVLPLLVYFDATPTRFEPGDNVSLHALAVKVGTNETFTGDLTFKFLEDGDSNSIIREVNVSSGEAYANWTYPDDSQAHTVLVVVQLQVGTQIPHMVEPINLDVYQNTRLLFWIDRDNSSKHSFLGRLLAEDVAAADKQIRAYLNGTLIDGDLTTNTTGYFGFERNFNPGEKKIFYTSEVVFEGTDNETVLLNGTDFMGNPYVVCRTQQFNYRPSSNMTSLIIEPQVTEITIPVKTPEELKEEAEYDLETGEGLQIWHEFSWFYPWHRTHFAFWRNETCEFDVGKAELPFGDTFQYAQVLIQRLVELLPRVMWSVVATIGVGEFLALIASNAGFVGLWGALFYSTASKLLVLDFYWNSIDGLISAYIGSLFATVLGLLRMSFLRIAVDILELLMGIKSLAEFGFGKLYSILSVPANIAFQSIILGRLDELGAF